MTHKPEAQAIGQVISWQVPAKYKCRDKTQKAKGKVNGGSSLRALHLRTRRGQLEIVRKISLLQKKKRQGLSGYPGKVCRVVINQSLRGLSERVHTHV